MPVSFIYCLLNLKTPFNSLYKTLKTVGFFSMFKLFCALHNSTQIISAETYNRLSQLHLLSVPRKQSMEEDWYLLYGKVSDR